MKKTLIRLFQLFILLVIRLVYLGRVKTIISENDTKITGPVVIAANHANSMDPFIIACLLPLRTILRVFPYGFMTANVYYYRWWKPLSFLAGCYPAKARYERANPNSYGVGRSVKLLDEGYSVVMFPEGKRTKNRLPAKPGISHILRGSDAKLLLCHLEWTRNKRFREVRMHFQTADEPLRTSDPDAIMKAVYELELNIELAAEPQKASTEVTARL